MLLVTQTNPDSVEGDYTGVNTRSWRSWGPSWKLLFTYTLLVMPLVQDQDAVFREVSTWGNSSKEQTHCVGQGSPGKQNQ